MVDSSPSEFENSQLYTDLLNAQAEEYDAQLEKDADLEAQLTVATATWGLKYWEAAFGITTNENDSYQVRRGKVTAKRIGAGNFSAKHLYALAAGYGDPIRVSIDVSTYTITVTFMNGIPSYLEEYKDAVENIIHAHLGTEYKFEYYITTGVNIATNYTKYLYNLPIVGMLCGVYPDPAATGKSYPGTLNAAVTIEQAVKEYEATLNAATAETTTAHNYPYTGTFNSSEGAKT